MSLLSRNNKNNSQTQNVYQEEKKQRARKTELSWETFQTDLLEKSEQKAWFVAKVACAGVVILCFAIAAMSPLKTVEPYVIQVDKSTGMTEILHIANEQDIPVDELMDKYWVSQFLYSHQSYDFNMLNDDIDKVRLLSVPDVYEEFIKQFSGATEEPLDKKLGNKVKIVVKIKSIVINRAAENVATVRFSKSVVDLSNGVATSTTIWIGNISYEYHPNYSADEATKIVNPFGFKVVSFRLDPEFR